MILFNKTILPIILTGIWINVSESLRWIFLVKSHWIEHYEKLSLDFPTEPINGITWMIWGFLLAISIFIISRKFNLIQTTLISWLLAFVMLWVVLWNIDIFPIRILWIVVPLSLFELFVGALICKKISPA